MPTGRQVHIDSALSNLLVASFESMGDFVAPTIFPIVPVGKQSDKYYTLKKEAWLRVHKTQRAPRTQANRIEFDISSDSYYCNNYALAAEIPIEDIANQDPALSLRDSNTMFIARGLLSDMEARVANECISNVSTVSRLTGANAWDAVNSADIQTQIIDAHRSIFRNTGLRANALVMDYDSYMYARQNARLQAKFIYQQQGNEASLLSDAQLKAAFMVDEILIARSQKNNATQGSASITSIWGPTALLMRKERAVSRQTATFGLSFRWNDPALGTPMAVTSKLEDDAGSRHIEILEGMYYQDEKVIATDLGYYIQTKSGMVW